jgi:hypothetical protein
LPHVDDGIVGHLVEPWDEVEHFGVVGKNRSSEGGDEDWPAPVLAETAERMRLKEHSIQGLGYCPRRVQAVGTWTQSARVLQARKALHVT